MNVNITGIYDNTVRVDNNLFENIRLLQTGLSSLSDTYLMLLRAFHFNMQIKHHLQF
jgi:hypothetical protein